MPNMLQDFLSGVTGTGNPSERFSTAEQQPALFNQLMASRKGPVPGGQSLYAPERNAGQQGYDAASVGAARRAQWNNLKLPGPITYLTNRDASAPNTPWIPKVPGMEGSPYTQPTTTTPTTPTTDTPTTTTPATNPNANPIQGNTHPSNADGAGYVASSGTGPVQVGNPNIQPGNINSAAYNGYQPGNQVGPYSTGKMPNHALTDPVPVPAGTSPETAKLLEGLTYNSFMQPDYAGAKVSPYPIYNDPTAKWGGSGGEVQGTLAIAPNYPGWDMYRTESNTGAMTNMTPAEKQARQQQVLQQYQAWLQATGYGHGDQWFTGQNMGELHSQGQ